MVVLYLVEARVGDTAGHQAAQAEAGQVPHTAEAGEVAALPLQLDLLGLRPLVGEAAPNIHIEVVLFGKHIAGVRGKYCNIFNSCLCSNHRSPLTLLLGTGAGVVEVQGLAGGLVTWLHQLHPNTGPGVTT